MKAGTRWDGVNAAYKDLDSGANPIAVNKLANAGYVVCSQSAAVKQASTSATVLDIVLPAGSMIISMQAIVTVAYNTTSDDDLQVMLSDTAGLRTTLTTYVDLGAVGVYNLVPDNAAMAARWKNVNSDAGISDNASVDIEVDSGTGGSAGRAILTLNYIPGLNL